MNQKAPQVRMGVCNVNYGMIELGHTKGGVKLSYKVESESVDTDQSDAPIDVVITKQPVEVTVPMVEGQLEKLAGLIPNCHLITDTIDPTRKRLEITGESGGSLAKNAKMLVLTPVSGNANDIVTLYHAACLPEFDMSFEKGTNIHIYSLRFVALRGENGYVAFGDPLAMESATVVAPEPIEPEPIEPPEEVTPDAPEEEEPTAPEESEPDEDTETEELIDIDDIEILVTTAANLRSEASADGGDATVIMRLEVGTVLVIAGEAVADSSVADRFWLPVIYENSDSGEEVTGYINQAYVSIDGVEAPTEGEGL